MCDSNVMVAMLFPEIAKHITVYGERLSLAIGEW